MEALLRESCGAGWCFIGFSPQNLFISYESVKNLSTENRGKLSLPVEPGRASQAHPPPPRPSPTGNFGQHLCSLASVSFSVNAELDSVSRPHLTTQVPSPPTQGETGPPRCTHMCMAQSAGQSTRGAPQFPDDRRANLEDQAPLRLGGGNLRHACRSEAEPWPPGPMSSSRARLCLGSTQGFLRRQSPNS